MMIFHESKQQDFDEAKLISEACTAFDEDKERRPKAPKPVQKKLF